jgi:uncharacterized membrane protein
MKAYVVIALATAIGIVSAQAEGDHSGDEKCYGIAKAGKNDCGNATGTHTCGGKATTDHDPNEWMWVEQGKCVEMGGSTTAPAS